MFIQASKIYADILIIILFYTTVIRELRFSIIIYDVFILIKYIRQDFFFFFSIYAFKWKNTKFIPWIYFLRKPLLNLLWLIWSFC